MVDVPEDEEDKNGFLKACALIRSNLHIDPPLDSDDDFATAYAQALWLEEIRMKHQADIMKAIFTTENAEL